MKQYEFSQVTTRGGDGGETSLANGERLRKDDLLFHTLGSIDELNSQLGVVRGSLEKKQAQDIITVQERLQVIGGMLAVPKRSEQYEKIRKIDGKDIEELEKREYRLMQHCKVPDKFVLPGDSLKAAHTHVARAVCRRVERWMVGCIRERGLNQLIPAQQYLNRLADYLFILGLWLEQNDEDGR
ncbi:MAG: cob(I)yrinic acid a,c-diamide adenosyltransferase [Spirochaetia bacterium]|nr:cob(I)yrinic acid a,c-diamide adenosyltransferase [Spirochaetia bacterium]